MTEETSLTAEQVAHLARLARLQLSEDEVVLYAGQLDQILHSVQQVSTVAADDVVPMSHPQSLVNVWRVDEVAATLSKDQALSGAPAVEDERFRVPRILDGE